MWQVTQLTCLCVEADQVLAYTFISWQLWPQNVLLSVYLAATSEAATPRIRRAARMTMTLPHQRFQNAVALPATSPAPCDRSFVVRQAYHERAKPRQ